MEKHVCKYCGCTTTQPDDRCYKKPGMLTSNRAKAIYKWILVIALAFLFHTITNGQNISGNGTAGNPYILYSAEDVDSIRNLGATKYYKLNNDIDMTSENPFTPIPSTGTFGQLNMNHKTISNLQIVHTPGAGIDSVGMFRGILVASANSVKRVFNGTFLNCKITVSNATYNSDADAYGMLAGYYSTSGGSHTVSAFDSLIFYNTTIVVTCTTGSAAASGWAMGTVFGNHPSPFGGAPILSRIAVINSNLVLHGRNNSHSVPTDGVGGILGYGWITINKSFVMDSRIQVDGATTSTQGTPAGGIVGRRRANSGGSSSTITDCYVRGTFIGSTNYSAGGFIGHHIADPVSITDSYVQIDSLRGITSAGTDDYDGIFSGLNESNMTFTTVYADTQALVYDLTQTGAYDKSIVGFSEGHTGTGTTKLTTANALIEGSYTGFDFSSTWDTDIAFNDGYPHLDWFNHVVYVDPIVKYPDAANLFFYQDSTLNITWSPPQMIGSGTLTKQYIQYSTDAGLSWTPIDSILNIIDSTYDWIIPAIITTQGKIRISTDVAGVQDSSSNNFVIAPNEAQIDILEPDGNNYSYTTSSLIFVVETFNIGYIQLWYSKDSTNWILIVDSLDVDNGNGIPPDTTTYSWTVGDVDLISTTWYRANSIPDTLFTGSEFQDNPYHFNDELDFVGLRSKQGQQQAYWTWSNFFERGGKLMTVSHWAFVYGWFDLADLYSIAYWNVLTNTWTRIDYDAPNTAYVNGKCYHRIGSSVPYMVLSDQTGTHYKTAIWNNTPVLTDPLSASITGSIATVGVDPSTYSTANDETDYDGWRYYLDGTDIRAHDIFNVQQNIDFLFLQMDVDSLGNLDPENCEIFAHDSLLFISNSNHKGAISFEGGGSGYLTMSVYTLPTLQQQFGDYAEDITSTAGLEFQQRNYFRGIYPEAILQMRSRK